MANTNQARKRARQNISNRQRNVSRRSAMRTAIKNALALLSKKNANSEKNKEQLTAAFRKTSSILDKAAQRGLIHKNKAARNKKRLSKGIKELQTS